jgi:hypothetical protein
VTSGIPLARHGGGLLIEARKDGLYATSDQPGIRLSNAASWPREWFDSPRAVRAALQLSHLAELGLAEEGPAGLRVAYQRFPELFAKRFSLPLLWSDWSPFTLSIRTHGTLTEDDFRVAVKFKFGDLDIEVERSGRYVRRLGHPETWLLDGLAFNLVERVESWRGGEARWIDFAFLKAYASELCAEVDPYLRDNDVVFPVTLHRSPLGGGLRGFTEPFVDGVPEQLFRRAFRSSAPDKRMQLLLPQGTWVHLIFDDEQLKLLRALKVGGGSTILRSSPTLTGEACAGRVGSRKTNIGSKCETVPVRLRGERHVLERAPGHAPGGQPLYDRDVHSMRRNRLEALVACLYAERGFRVILAPEDYGGGASVVAVQDGIAWLVRVETAPAGLEALNAMVRMRAAYRHLYDHPYRLALMVRNSCDRELKVRAVASHIEMKDGVQLIDEIESNSISSEDVRKAERSRRRSWLEVIEQLQQLLAAGQPS